MPGGGPRVAATIYGGDVPTSSSSTKASTLSKIAVVSALAGLTAPLVLLGLVVERLAVGRLRKEAKRVSRSVNVERDRWRRKVTLAELLSGPTQRRD